MFHVSRFDLHVVERLETANLKLETIGYGASRGMRSSRENQVRQLSTE